MSFKNVIISSGHGKIVRGAAGILDEVDEARRVVERVAENLRDRGAQVSVFHDNISTSQSENLERIVDYHNSQNRQLDISVHFNAYVETTKPMGTEVLYFSQSVLANHMSAAIAGAGQFINRGPKKRTDLYFLNNTDMPAILIEVCFVDSQVDAELYGENFDAICAAIAAQLKDKEGEEPAPEPPSSTLLLLSGKVSNFGGPKDTGVAPDEGLAFIYKIDDAPHLFLPYQPVDTSGLARRLNPHIHYVACRWDYNITPPGMLLSKPALVRVEGGIELTAFPSDWGPHPDTGRIADISPGLMEDLGIQTDDEVEIVFPAPPAKT
jgi:N-acetylmuramoyl-L-alanine amidase